MIFVWSTRLRPVSTASVRVSCRTLTTSSEERISGRSLFPVGILGLGLVETDRDQIHAALDIQRRLYARERKAKLHQRDCDRRPHAHHHGVGIEDARHRRDVVEHAANKTVDDLERRDVDQHALGAVINDFFREIFFERRREPVVHIDLDGHEQRIPELEDRNAVHDAYSAGCCSGVVFLAFSISPGLSFRTPRPVRLSATAKASASVALEMTLSSTPRCTMVCAICGRMPLMMQSAPIRRAAATVFSRCCAVRVSTVGTPVMSMMAISAPSSTMCWSRFSITTWVRSLSRVPMIGSASTPSQSFTTGVDSSAISRCWRMITSSRLFWNTSRL